jgi:hypothetical protein
MLCATSQTACPLRARWNGHQRRLADTRGNWRTEPDPGRSSSPLCDPQPSTLVMPVRSRSPAPLLEARPAS